MHVFVCMGRSEVTEYSYSHCMQVLMYINYSFHRPMSFNYQTIEKPYLFQYKQMYVSHYLSTDLSNLNEISI